MNGTRFTLILMILGASCASAHDYSDEIVHVVEQMISLEEQDAESPWVGGRCTSDGCVPHPFFLLKQFIEFNSKKEDIEAMITSEHTLLRVAAASIILNGRVDYGIEKEKINPLLSDETEICHIDACTITTTTVGKLILTMKENRNLFR